MHRSTLFAFCAAIFAASVAVAQEGPPPPTAEDIAVAQAEADELIAKSRHPALFKNVSDGHNAEVLHLASGMTCMFDPDSDVNNLHVYDPEPATEDVGCTTTFKSMTITHYASR